MTVNYRYGQNEELSSDASAELEWLKNQAEYLMQQKVATYKADEELRLKKEREERDVKKAMLSPKFCKITDCGRRVSYGELGYCESHRKSWVKFKKRGVAQERYEYLISREYCDCCGGTLTIRNMDHDHSHCPSNNWCDTCIRGVVCSRCNGLLAGLDDEVFYQNALKYKQRYANGLHR